ncbi:hypothetical protein BKH38_09260 [Actinomyces naeslundii]|nr:hypothetical protein BKH38_09260 [Actinomyces naeslundii]OMG41223.1 hypothetical protein BKH14_01155 [Actinomyces naeslundii]
MGRWTRPGESSVSMMLTSTPHRCRTPRRNRSIPTILEERFDGGDVDVSAVDTGLSEGPRWLDPTPPISSASRRAYLPTCGLWPFRNVPCPQ